MTVKARIVRLFATSIGAVLLTITLVLVPSTVNVRLAAQTLLMMGGNADPYSANVHLQLNGIVNPADPRYVFPGTNLVKVPWISDSFDLDPGYTASQANGIAQMYTYIDYFIDDPFDKVTVYGYSSGAQVTMNVAKLLQAQGGAAPAPHQLSFINVASPYRGNGGVFSRFRGLNLLGIPFEGPNPATGYSVTDIAYKYDPISDFPQYPLMPLSLLNSLIAWQSLHIGYWGPQSDLSNVILDPNMTYHDSSTGINYVTLAPPHLPLLMPAYQIGEAVPFLRPFIEPVLKLIEPTLTMLVDLGYDRSVPVGQARPANLIPLSLLNPIKIGVDLLNAVLKGVQDALVSVVQGITGTLPPSGAAIQNFSVQGDPTGMSLLSADRQTVAGQGAETKDKIENIEQQSVAGGDIQKRDTSGTEIAALGGADINTLPPAPEPEKTNNLQVSVQINEIAGNKESDPQDDTPKDTPPGVVGGLADPDPTAPPSQNLDPGAEGDDDTSGVKNDDTSGVKNDDTSGVKNDDTSGVKNDDTSGVKNDDNESGVATTPRKRQFGNRLFERQHSKRWKTVESKDATSGGPEKDATSGAPEKDATSGAPEKDATSGAPEKDATSGAPEKDATSAADPDPKPKANDDAA
jgi:pimeloyl-ACP methyl ester carboxylesterase